MNGKFSNLLSLSRSYHQHSQIHHHHQKLNSYSLQAWRFFVEKLKQDFSSSERRLEYFKRIHNGLKIVASFLGKECSPIVAQRAFRGYRILLLHSRLWSYNSSNPVSKRALLSFVMLSLCQGKNNLKLTIADSELTTHKKDLDYIRVLTAATVVCDRCKDRLTIDKKLPGVKYCCCLDSPRSVFSRTIEGHPWQPFAETPDLLIWRMPHPDHPELFIYKVYGYYDDISAQDFLDVQLDIDYRRKWDNTALHLDVVEKDPKSNSDVIYWEIKWPRMFANRDYVFVRRHKVYRDQNDMVIMSKAVTHPDVPEKDGVQRVTEYWSVMHVRAAKGLSQTGVEFGLTYFDNPGLSLPQWLMNWAAMTGIPEFLTKQRTAARLRRVYGGRPPVKKSSIAVSSQTYYSDKTGDIRKPTVVAAAASSSPPTTTISNTSPQGSRNVANITKSNPSDVITSKHSSSSSNSPPKYNIIAKQDINSDINSENSTSSSTTPPSGSTPQQQEGKKELLSQFFKEQILEVQS